MTQSTALVPLSPEGERLHMQLYGQQRVEYFNPLPQQLASFAKISEGREGEGRQGDLVLGSYVCKADDDNEINIPVFIIAHRVQNLLFAKREDDKNVYLEEINLRIAGHPMPQPIGDITAKVPQCTSDDLDRSSGTLMWKDGIIMNCEKCPHASRFFSHKRQKYVDKRFRFPIQLTETQARALAKQRGDDFFTWYWGDNTAENPGMKSRKCMSRCSTHFMFLVLIPQIPALTVVTFRKSYEGSGKTLAQQLKGGKPLWSYAAVLTKTMVDYGKGTKPFWYPDIKLVGVHDNWETHQLRGLLEQLAVKSPELWPQATADDAEYQEDEAELYGLDFDMPAEAKPAPQPAAPAPAPQPAAPAPQPAPAPVETAPEPAPAPAPAAAPAPEPADDLDTSALSDL